MNVLIVNLDEINTFDIRIDSQIEPSDIYNFIIYEIDDEETIKNRICAGLKTLPSYLFFYENHKYVNNLPMTRFVENQEIKVFDLLNFIIRNVKINFDQLVENEHVKKIIDMKIKQKNFDIIYSIAKPFIIYNKDYEDLFLNDFGFGPEQFLMDLIIKIEDFSIKLKYNGKNENKKDNLREVDKNYEKRIVKDKIIIIWNNMMSDKKIYTRNIEELIQKSYIQLSKIQEFQEIEAMDYTSFTTDKTELKIQLDLNNISLLEIFNNIELTDDITFAKCEDFYKIFIGTIPKIEWLDTVNNSIILKLKTKKDAYIDIKIEKIIDVKSENFNKYFITFKFSQMDFTRDEIIEKIFSIFKNKINILKEESTDINGVFYIPFNELGQTYNKYIFSDLIMNDDFVSIMLTIDESDKAEKSQFHIHYNNMITGQISARITSQIIKKEKDIVKYGLEDYDLDINNQFLRIKISKCNNLESVNKFQLCLSKILRIYSDKFNDIYDYYDKFYTEEEFHDKIYKDEEDEDVDETDKKLKDIYPELFNVQGYTKACVDPPKIILNKDDFINYIEEDDVNKNPREVMIYPLKHGKKYICLHDNKKLKPVYPGLRENKLDNKDEFPYLPCCFPVMQKDKKFGSHFQIVTRHDEYEYKEDDEDEDEDEDEDKEKDKKINKAAAVKPGQTLIKKYNFILPITVNPGNTINSYGLLPANIKKFFDFFEEDKYDYIRQSIERDKNSLIRCVLTALKEDLRNVEDIRKSFYIKTNYKKWSNAILCKQECYDISVNDIEEKLSNPNEYFSLDYIRLLEYEYKCNIFVFRYYKSNKNPINTLVLPKYMNSYYKEQNKNRCIFIYEHNGNDKQKYPHFELIIRSKIGGTSVESVFDYDSQISRQIMNVYNKLGNVLYYDKSIITEEIVDINTQLLLLNVPIISQIIDSYGKTQILNIDLGDKLLSLFINPIQPLNLQEDDINNIYYADDKFIDDIITKLQITELNKVGNIIYGKIFNFTVSFKIYNNVSNNSIINKYNKYKKISRYVTEYMFWLYSRYLQKNIQEYDYNNLIKFENMNDFVTNNFVLDKNFQYDDYISNQFTLENNGIIRDSKIVVKSDSALKRLLYVLRLKIIRDYKEIIQYHTYNNIYSYYLDMTDFDQNNSQVILKGYRFARRWVQDTSKDNKYVLRDSVLISENNLYCDCYGCTTNDMLKNKKCEKCNENFPSFNILGETVPKYCDNCATDDMINVKICNKKQAYFFKNKLISDDTYLAQNTDSIEKAVKISVIWYTKGYNIGNNPELNEYEDLKYSFQLYAYQNNNMIKKYNVVGNNSDIDIKIIGFYFTNSDKKRQKMFTALLGKN